MDQTRQERPIAAFASALDGGAAAFLVAANASGIEMLDVTLEHAASAAALPRHHRDPFDRMLIAQAMHERLTLVAHDDEFDRYRGLQTLKT